MTVIKTTPLSELPSGTVLIYEGDDGDRYYVDLPDTDYLIVVMMAEYPHPTVQFDHPGVIAAYSTIGECKHYRKDGGKRWTRHALREFYFAIPKTRIAMRHEKGYSYVPVLISGEAMTFNVSGGSYVHDGRHDWRDHVGTVVGTCITKKKRHFMALARAAWTASECREHGVVVKFPDGDLARSYRESYPALVAEKLVQAKLNTGDKFTMKSNIARHNNIPTDGWTVLSRERGRKVRAQDLMGHHWNVKLDQIDWLATAQVNDWNVNGEPDFNRTEVANAFTHAS